MLFDREQLESEALEHFGKAYAALSGVLDLSASGRDHIGYRCSSGESYEEKKIGLLRIGQLLKENIISQRKISVFRLDNPVDGFNLLELAEPKEGEKHFDGVDHLAYMNQDLEALHRRLEQAGIKTKTIKDVLGSKLFKAYPDGLEVEFRDVSIEK